MVVVEFRWCGVGWLDVCGVVEGCSMHLPHIRTRMGSGWSHKQ